MALIKTCKYSSLSFAFLLVTATLITLTNSGNQCFKNSCIDFGNSNLVMIFILIFNTVGLTFAFIGIRHKESPWSSILAFMGCLGIALIIFMIFMVLSY